MTKLKTTSGIIGALIALNWAGNTWAGNDLYFVTYNHHIAKGELEVMVMNDFTDPSKFKRQDDGQRSYFSQMIEVEYGLTDQWAIEPMFEGFEEPSTGRMRFTGFRFETRYRLFRREVPLNPILYVEYEDLDPLTRFKMEVSGWIRPPYRTDGAEPDRERILESRLILSQDFGPLNAAFNWINESDLNESGFTAFGYSLGVRYDFIKGHYGKRGEGETPAHADHPHGAAHGTKRERHLPSVGLEFYGGLGDTQSLALEPTRQEHYLQPVLMLHLSERVMFHLGAAIGLSKASDNLIRTALAIEF
ncbi:MAG: hypothetical protein HYY24_17055 [Verrucomicrobia bacterium]|nr:hypothetical protein [Verrucomicrobiota bacterium]